MRPTLGVLLASLSTMLIATTAVASPPHAGDGSTATSEIAGSIFTVTPRIDFTSATLRIVGPDGYEAIAWSTSGVLGIDLLTEGYYDGSDGRDVTALEPLPDGRYGYEVVFYQADGGRLTYEGVFSLEGGAPRDPIDESTYPAAILEGLASDEPGGMTNVTAAGTTADDFLDVWDAQEDGQTSVSMRSAAADSFDPEHTWRIANDQGFFRIIAGLPQLSNEIKPFTVTTDKRVGIGTTQPQADLHIFSPGGVIRITDSDPCPNPSAAWEIEEDFGKLKFEVVSNCPGDPVGGKMWIAGSGNVGIGTAFPDRDLTIHDATDGGDIGLSGAGAQYTVGIRPGTGDFVIQGAGGIGQDAFRITPDAFDEAMTIGAGGVGIGTASPQARFHVTSPASTSRLRLQAGSGFRDFVAFSDGGFEIQGAGGGSERSVRIFPGTPDNAIVLHPAGVGIGTASPQAKLHVLGGGIIEGDVALGSSRTIKHEIEPLDSAEILTSIRDLPIYAWKYKDDPLQAAHVGPMAEDVHAAFRLGRDAKHLSPSDSAGLALAAVQGVDRRLAGVGDRLDRELDELRTVVAALSSRNGELASENEGLRYRLAAIELLLGNLPISTEP